MDSIEFKPQELSKRSEGMESAETQALEDATFEPTAFIEQTSDFRQAEAIQSSLETVMANIPGNTVEGQQPQVVEGVFEKSPGKDDGGEDITPINLPGVQEVAGGETGFKYDTKESAGMGETPLPATAGETSPGMEQVSDLPGPLPRPAGEASADVEQVGALPDPIPRPAGEASPGMEQVSTIPGPLPRPAGETSLGMEQVSDLPEPMPRPAGEASPGMEQVSTIPGPLPRPDMEAGGTSHKGEADALPVPIPFPRPEAEMGSQDSARLSAREGEVVEQMIVRTTAAMQEMQMSFNLQYLMLQNKISHENRQYSMQSNILKDDNDTAKNSINNIR